MNEQLDKPFSLTQNHRHTNTDFFITEVLTEAMVTVIDRGGSYGGQCNDLSTNEKLRR